MGFLRPLFYSALKTPNEKKIKTGILKWTEVVNIFMRVGFRLSVKKKHMLHTRVKA